MITLNVYFGNDLTEYGSTATLLESLITNKVDLILSNKIFFLNETHFFIDKAVEKLKCQYEKVDVKIHWDTAVSVREEDKNVITSE